MYRTFAYIQRDLLRWSRSPLNIVSTLAMPAAWLIFVRLVMPVRHDNYLDFVTPGVLVLTTMTAGLAVRSFIMFDKTLGYLNKFLALPAPRGSILLGKITFIVIRGLMQASVILVMAIVIGATVYPPTSYLGMYFVLFMFGVAISALGSTIALSLHDFDTYSAVQGVLSMPLYFAFTALIAYDEMPRALQIISDCNPLSYAIEAMRGFAAGEFPLYEMGVLAVLCAAILLICAYRFQKVTMR